MKKDFIIVLDFGGQYNQLIVRRIRELGVYSELFPYSIPANKLKKLNLKGIILSGGPKSVYKDKAFKVDRKLFDLGIPILGICYGTQLIVEMLGGKVKYSTNKEYGKRKIILLNNSCLLCKNIIQESISWMSHMDQIKCLPKDFIEFGKTETMPYAIIGNIKKSIYGFQFHPEVEHTEYGKIFIKNFLFGICKCKKNWKINSFVSNEIDKIKNLVKNEKVLCALSGGVDSTVAAIIVHKAIKDNLICMFIDHGLLRKGEKEFVKQFFKKKFKLKLFIINAKNIFLKSLKNEKDPEKKRKIIGTEFIKIFEKESKKIGKFKFLVQGTIYPDIIESGTDIAETIKSHHNVGGLPKSMKFNLIEPIKFLFKDEVRKIGSILKIPNEILKRQPFPGPGLGIRILGQINNKKLKILKDADFIVREEIELYDKKKKIWQFFAILSNTKSVGVMGDKRTYSYVIILRIITSSDGMTADWYKLPYNILEKISTRIVNEVEGVNRVVYDITSKPPGTIEWE